MRLIFRVDCNSKTGFGHLSRVINLCRTWRDSEGLEDFTFLGNYNDFGVYMLEEYAFPYKQVECDDFSDLGLNAIDKGDIVFIDSYLLNQKQLNELVAKGNKVILLDDECLLDYEGVHAVVNFRFDAEKLYQYNSIHALLGIDYFIVKPELVDLRASRMAINPDFELERILLFFGGGFRDSAFISGIISILNKEVPDSRVILLGDQNEVEGRFERVKPSSDFHVHLANVDALINGGGVIKYESSFSLIPTGSFSTSQLQYEDSIILGKLGVHADFGLIGDQSLAQKTSFDSFIMGGAMLKRLFTNCREIYGDSPTLYLTRKLNEIL